MLLGAGTVTTATSISSALVYLLLDPKRMGVLLDELETAMPDITKPKSGTELAQLPYLVRTKVPHTFGNRNSSTDNLQSAVVHEVLRLVTGVSYRLARSAPHESLQLGEWTIPPNVRPPFHTLHHTLNSPNDLTDSSQHARPPNPPLARCLPGALVLHPRALAPHSHTSRSPRTTCAHPGRKPQVPCPAL